MRKMKIKVHFRVAFCLGDHDKTSLRAILTSETISDSAECNV